jgi:hypothetical protein
VIEIEIEIGEDLVEVVVLVIGNEGEDGGEVIVEVIAEAGVIAEVVGAMIVIVGDLDPDQNPNQLREQIEITEQMMLLFLVLIQIVSLINQSI